MMLTGGKWGEASCAHCNRSLGAAITCPHCGFINAHVDSDGEALAEQEKQEPVATVNANDEGYWADILPDRDVKVGQLLYVAPVSVEAAVLAERKRCAEACYLRAQSWKDNAARAAKLCGDAITSMGDTK